MNPHKSAPLALLALLACVSIVLETPDANAQKALVCPECNDTGQASCQNCVGQWKQAENWVTCTQCKGDGSFSCKNCHGKRFTRCTICNGRGTLRKKAGSTTNRDGWSTPNYGGFDCEACDGGRRQCQACSMSGPNGVVVCKVCQGAGGLVRRGKCLSCNKGIAKCTTCAIVKRMNARLPQPRPAAVGDYFDSLLAAARERGAFGTTDDLLSGGGDPSGLVAAWYLLNTPAPEQTGFYLLARQNRERLLSFFKKMRGAARVRVEHFSTYVPFDFGVKEGKPVLVIKGVMMSSSLNIRSVCDTLISPLLSLMALEFEGRGIGYYAVVIGCGCRRPIDPNDPCLSQCAVLLVDAETCRRFGRGQITYSELLSQCEFFEADSTRGIEGGLTKVTPRGG